VGLFSTHIHREGFQGIEDSDENEKENRIEVTNTAANPVPSMRYRLPVEPHFKWNKPSWLPTAFAGRMASSRSLPGSYW